MKRVISFTLIVLLTSGLLAAWTKDVNPADAIKELTTLRTTRLAEAREKKTTIDVNALNREILEKAKTYCEGVDPAKIDPATGLSWAQLFNMAEMHQETIKAADRFLTTNPEKAQKMQAQMLILDAAAELKNGAVMRNTLDTMSPTNASESYSYAVRAVYYVAEQVEKSEGAQAALDLINGAEGKINYSQFQSKEEKQRADSTISLFAGKRADLLTTIGKKDEALQALETAVARLTPDNKQAQSSLLAKKTQIQITGSPAPALAIERGHGDFKGLNAYKGKVILIDFFAHWCGPCIRSFPAMKKMYADLHSKGLEIFGVTTYYGYYKQEKPLDHDAEFAKMKDFIGEHGLPWAVLYGERTNFQAYGVSGIPHVVLIDKAGNVNYIKIGYSEEGLAHLREKIEALLTDKARNTSEQ